jgi:protein SCO1/2
MGRIAIALPAVLLLAACSAPADGAGVLVSSAPDTDGYFGAAIDPAYAKPAVTLTDTAGQPYDLSKDMTDQVTLVFFGYTSCPDVCSTVLADATAAIRRLPAEVAYETGLVFITTDPARDSPEVIRAYLDQFDRDYVGLHAGTDVIQQAADAFAVAYEPPVPEPGGYEVEHGTQLIGFGPAGAPGIIWTAGTAVGDLRADIARLAEES